MTAPGAARPELGPRDLYVYAFGNGAIFVLEADGRSRLATLDDAIASVERCSAAGGAILLAWDDEPMAEHVIVRIGALGVAVSRVPEAPAPHVWSEGTDALMEAASLGSDAILDDLLARGADVRRRDASGSTALHHAAANGNLHAVDALVAAGAELDTRNRDGFTPYRIAVATRQLPAAQRLADLGAGTEAEVTEPVEFARGNLGALYVWALIPVLALVTSTVVFVSAGPVFGVIALVLLVGSQLFVAPPRAFWSGGAPRRLEGTTLTIRGVGGERDVDLRAVTVAAIGGSTGRQAMWGARWLLLAHPDGHPVTERSLRRLLVAPAELEALAARLDRVVVVPIQGGGHDAVVLAIGNALSGLGVDLSASLRAQLARARQDRHRQ